MLCPAGTEEETNITLTLGNFAPYTVDNVGGGDCIILQNIAQNLTPKDSKTNLVFPFKVPSGTQKLVFDFSYAPKELEDTDEALALARQALRQYAPPPWDDDNRAPEDYLPVVNLVTLSLDGPGGYRGCAHRHDPVQHHEVTGQNASLGLYAGAIEPGTWRVVINCHCVVSNPCRMTLQVWGMEDE